jgi:hypothetical protein
METEVVDSALRSTLLSPLTTIIEVNECLRFDLVVQAVKIYKLQSISTEESRSLQRTPIFNETACLSITVKVLLS